MLGLKLFEQCSKYAKFCGKEHILQTVPQKIGKIDTCGLKLAPKLEKDVVEIGANKTINFVEKVHGNVAAGEMQLIAAQNIKGEELGTILLSRSNTGVVGCNIPEEYLDSAGNILPSLNIDFLCSRKKGCGTELMKEAVKLSTEYGYGGRITLTAVALGDSIARSPIPFYRKLGLKCVRKTYEEQCQKFSNEIINKLQTVRTNGSLTWPGVHMYLPKENINMLLNY